MGLAPKGPDLNCHERKLVDGGRNTPFALKGPTKPRGYAVPSPTPILHEDNAQLPLQRFYATDWSCSGATALRLSLIHI